MNEPVHPVTLVDVDIPFGRLVAFFVKASLAAIPAALDGYLTTLDTIDLSDHDAFLDAVPHEWFRTLRREAPVYFNPETDGPGFYAVTRYADIREVHRHVEIFSSEIGGTSLEDLDEEQLEARKSMIDSDSA